MNQQEHYSGFLDSEKSIFVHYPEGNLINENKSKDRFSVKIFNGSEFAKKICLLDGGYDTHRVAKVDGEQTYFDADGNLMDGNYTFRADEQFVMLNDDYRKINNFENLGISAIITNELSKIQTLNNTNDQNIFCESDKSIDLFRKMQQYGAYRIAAIQVQSNNSSQFSRSLYILEAKATENSKIEPISFEDHFEPTNSVLTKIIVDKPINVSPKTLMFFEIPEFTETTITFITSASFDTKKALENIIKPQIFQKYSKK